MREEISIEMSFLLYCVRSFIEPCCGERLTAFPVERLDWECLIAFAQRHRLIPVIYSVLRKYKVKCPDVTWNKLRNARAKSIKRSLLQLAKLKIILEVFNARKIEVVVLKGMVLAQEVYGDMVNRVSSDIDLL
ncbi:MAG: nucleotidyltransferase family protein, partial [Exilibacterium sp.]